MQGGGGGDQGTPEGGDGGDAGREEGLIEGDVVVAAVAVAGTQHMDCVRAAAVVAPSCTAPFARLRWSWQ